MKVRDYINYSVAQISTQLKEVDLIVDISDVISNGTYTIAYEVAGSEESQMHFIENIQVSINFYFKSSKQYKKLYDESMEVVRNIRNKILSIQNRYSFRASNDFNIVNARFSSMRPTPLEASNKTLQIELTVTLDVAESKC